MNPRKQTHVSARVLKSSPIDQQDKHSYAVSMELLAQIYKKDIWLHELKRPYILPSPFEGQDYVCIIFANDPAITSDEMGLISDQLVASGCRYAVCAGIDCSDWDDAIAYAYLATDENYDLPDDTMVMTTWHENEPPAEVIWFGLHCTDFESVLPKCLILMIGADLALEARIRQYIYICLISDTTSPQ